MSASLLNQVNLAQLEFINLSQMLSMGHAQPDCK